MDGLNRIRQIERDRMKNVILLHGMFGNPANFWFGWLRTELESAGFKVTAPQMPDADKPHLKNWTDFALANLSFDTDTIIIGHSAGCPLTLSILQKIDKPVHRAILVAGFIRLKEMKDDDVMLLSNPDWGKIKGNAQSWCFLNSDNDPWGCDQHQGEALREKLGGTLVIASGEGHFGSAVFKRPYDTFPLLKALCLLP